MAVRRFNTLFVATCLAVFVCSACQGSAQVATAGDPQRSPDAISYLEASRASLTQPVLESDRAEQAKFVELQVTEARNPEKLPVSIRVDYQTREGQLQFLGSVSLFPADNPGKFLVATQGRVLTGGSLVLSVVLPDDLKSAAGWRIGLRRATFVR